MTGKHSLNIDENNKLKRQKQTVESYDEFDDLEDSITFNLYNSKFTDSDLYLDTINRKVLNFDLPIQCCSTLATSNILICLVCNKYLQGGSINSPAYIHSVDNDHHIFLNTEKCTFNILPEQLLLSQERSNELNDIKLLFNPVFIGMNFDKESFYGQTLSGRKYHVGFIPLVNDTESEATSITILHNMLYYAFAHISALRDLMIDHHSSDSQPLTNELSRLTKKIWSKYLFHDIVSSLSIENYVSNLSHKIGSDLKLFYSWMVNTLLKESKQIKEIFTGKVEFDGKKVKFSNLTVELPQPSVFKDGTSSSIKQYHLTELIKNKGYNIIKTPKVLVIYIDRSNSMKIEGIKQTLNTNVVNFDPHLLQVGDFRYRLVANITYDKKIHVLDKANEQYKEFDSASVKDIEKELLFISNSKLQFWEVY